MVPVSTLVVNDRPHFPGASSTKSVQLMSIRSTLDNVSAEAPDVFDLEITQPPTREDWVAGIREAVDASASDAPEFAADGGASRRVDEKYGKLSVI